MRVAEIGDNCIDVYDCIFDRAYSIQRLLGISDNAGSCQSNTGRSIECIRRC